MNKFYSVLFCLLFASNALMAAEEPATTEVAEPSTETQQEALTAEQQKAIEEARAFLKSLNRQTGEVKLEGAPATLNVPENFYFLGSKDANRVLVDLWGNPPGAEILGMLFPADKTPYDSDSWAVTIQYVEDGYVSDEDASELNYTDLLADMQSDTRDESKERVKAGYDSIELVGWAANPFYDQTSHKLHWAKELKFGQSPDNTLNYNIRVLGRKGVLVLNFIAGMNQLKEIEANVGSVLAIAEFNQGERYSDFNPDMDKLAAYGIGGLVAGKVLAKTGLLAAGLVLLKKFGVFILIGLAALFNAIFRRKKVSAES